MEVINRAVPAIPESGSPDRAETERSINGKNKHSGLSVTRLSKRARLYDPSPAACSATHALHSRPPCWLCCGPLLSPHAAEVAADVLSFLGSKPRPRQSLLRRIHLTTGGADPASLLMACQRWHLTLQDLEAIVLPPWGFEDCFRDWGTFRVFLYPRLQEFNDSEVVRYWSTTHNAWLNAVVTGRHCDVSGAVLNYNLDIKSAALPGKIQRHDQNHRSQAIPVSDVGPSLLGEVCGISFVGPDGLRYHSARWAALLDGTIMSRLMTDSYPTIAPGQDSSFAEGVLRGIRRVSWGPAHDWLFPLACQRRMLFLAWIGGILGLQPVWTRTVLPLVGWIDALPGPPRGKGIPESPVSFTSDGAPGTPELSEFSVSPELQSPVSFEHPIMPLESTSP